MSIRNDSERWKTIRTAIIGGWGTTLRLLLVILALSIAPAVAIWVMTR
jgi:hypothetical protein